MNVQAPFYPDKTVRGFCVEFMLGELLCMSAPVTDAADIEVFQLHLRAFGIPPGAVVRVNVTGDEHRRMVITRAQ